MEWCILQTHTHYSFPWDDMNSSPGITWHILDTFSPEQTYVEGYAYNTLHILQSNHYNHFLYTKCAYFASQDTLCMHRVIIIYYYFLCLKCACFATLLPKTLCAYSEIIIITTFYALSLPIIDHPDRKGRVEKELFFWHLTL